MAEPNDIVFAAAAFAARAHRHQLRKDRETPYVSHVFRVCLVVRHVFGFDDPRMLAAALLHDTIEDTATDRDDISDAFGADVARWVAALTKDMRLPDDEREAAYEAVLAASEWQVKACKLADIYDNLTDSDQLSLAGRKNAAARSERYLAALRPNLPEALHVAFQLTEAKLTDVRARIH
ncbi:MAG TPA: HD domain-containing protein [Urbifossiella sp.]|nr:HD domain-containing protein [Urbifossiella sp.]